MNVLLSNLNSWVSNSAGEPAAMLSAESTVAPCLTDPTVATVANSACISQGDGQPACDIAVGLSGTPTQERPLVISESAASLPALVERADAAGDRFATAPAAFSETQYKPETFLEHATRRSMPIISPPLPKSERDIDSIALNAVGAALNLHPRDLDLDPLFKLGQTP